MSDHKETPLPRGVNNITMQQSKQRVSVIVPTHNEAGTIAEVVHELVKHTPSLIEVLVIDDGSKDGTADIAEKAGARVIRMAVNGGKGKAIQRGIHESAGDVLVFIDGDGQDDPQETPQLLEALVPSVDMVIGSRFLGNFEHGSITMLNRIGTHCLTTTLNRLFGVAITDPIAGFRVIRKRALSGCLISAHRYDIEVDILLALLERGRRVVEVPVTRYPRTYGSTDLSSFVDGGRILRRILSRRVRLS